METFKKWLVKPQMKHVFSDHAETPPAFRMPPGKHWKQVANNPSKCWSWSHMPGCILKTWG